MQMNRNKIVMAAIGGAAGVAALVLGVLVWLESDSQAEILDDLEAQRGKLARYSGAVKATEDAHLENAKAAKEWADGAYAAMAARGVRSYDASQEPAAFKQQMVDEARALKKLPADSPSKFVEEGFGFGFNAYINEGSMPSREDLPRLQRQWDDIVRVSDILYKAGVTRLTGVAAKDPEPVPEDRSSRMRSRQQAKDPAAAYPSTRESYRFTFLARQEALVKALNALSADERFYAVDSLSFEQQGDPLVMMLGGDKEKDSGGGRRGRRRRAAQEEAKQEEGGDAAEIARKGLVTDPSTTAPFTVTLDVSTLDFSAREEEGLK